MSGARREAVVLRGHSCAPNTMSISMLRIAYIQFITVNTFSIAPRRYAIFPTSTDAAAANLNQYRGN